ncbi:hypothetical protein POM88_050133 [Heracleum sosnowskyi]|uniref:Uncharacterized protein n=1 Tax=Heracleum sosnowskyi TaxID=360622 RepID=A0AAD8GZG4_9APIA|nr:hypothetical protein POM88_050133 [Heracleum sosnowskyi]
MGNMASCFGIISMNTSIKTAKLIDFHGNSRHVNIPISVAELMLEHPGYFISPAEDLRRTLRFPPMKADEELVPGKLYMLVPTARLHSKASVSEIAVLDSACRNRRRSKRPSAKVLPTVVAEEEGEGEDSSGGLNDCQLKNKWRPSLLPIYEGK